MLQDGRLPMRGDVQSIDLLGTATENQQGFVVARPVRGPQAPLAQLFRGPAGSANVNDPLAFFVGRISNLRARCADHRKPLHIERTGDSRLLSARSEEHTSELQS